MFGRRCVLKRICLFCTGGPRKLHHLQDSAGMVAELTAVGGGLGNLGDNVHVSIIIAGALCHVGGAF